MFELVLEVSRIHTKVEHGTGCLTTSLVLLNLASTLLPPLFARMRSESDSDLRPGSSLTAESSTMAHTTATHKHKSPMHRLVHGLKRLNSYSNDNSDSSSSEDDEFHNGPGNGQDGSEEFVERHRVQEIRFNYESWSLDSPSFQASDPNIRFASSKEVLPDPRQMSSQIRCTVPSSWFSA